MSRSEESASRSASDARSRTPWLRYGIALALVLLVLAWQAGVFESRIDAGETAGTTRTVGDAPTVTATRWDGARERHLPGTVVARARIELAPRIVSRLERLPVAAGDRVQAGAIVAVLDARIARAEQKQAEAAVGVAAAKAAGAERLLTSIREAAQARSIPRTEQIRAEQRRDMARHTLDEARAARDRARARLSFTHLESPVAGVVVDTLADPGDLVSPERPILSLYRPDELEVAVNVPAALAPRLAPGAALELYVPGLDAGVTGTVRTREAAADPASRTVLLRVRAPLPAAAVPGLYAEARLPIDEPLIESRPVVVPGAAIERVRQLTFVHVVRAGGGLERRLVRLGRDVGDRVLVLAGLGPGEEILARAPPRAQGEPGPPEP